MVKPSDAQLGELIELREFVIEVMTSMGVWSNELLTKLTTIELGVLRKNATQRHGVTRWRQGIKNPTIPEEVQVIELHPKLLSSEWKPYAAWVMHHEFVHALGYTAHDSTFRSLERLWPSKQASTMGVKFTEELRKEKAKWLWVCDKCKKEYPRQKKGMGKYMCKSCKQVLRDVPVDASQ